LPFSDPWFLKKGGNIRSFLQLSLCHSL
jgi:hypothetical protein